LVGQQTALGIPAPLHPTIVNVDGLVANGQIAIRKQSIRHVLIREKDEILLSLLALASIIINNLVQLLVDTAVWMPQAVNFAVELCP
jgi:hypothetical protein